MILLEDLGVCFWHVLEALFASHRNFGGKVSGRFLRVNKTIRNLYETNKTWLKYMFKNVLGELW